MIGLAPKRRAPVKRTGWLRAYPARLSRGLLTLLGGAWIKRVDDDEKRFDRTKRLFVNLDDKVILIGSDCAAVQLTGIERSGFVEVWRIAVLYGSCADGDVVVMKMRGAR